MFGLGKKKPPFRERIKQSARRYVQPMKDGAKVTAEAASYLRSKVRKPRRDILWELQLRADFRNVMDYWEVNENQLHYVLRGLRIEAWVWTLISIACFVWTAHSILEGHGIAIASGAIGMVAAICIALPRYWRRHVLKTRQFVPFTEWLGFKNPDRE